MLDIALGYKRDASALHLGFFMASRGQLLWLQKVLREWRLIQFNSVLFIT